jgi:hypothetical protein
MHTSHLTHSLSAPPQCILLLSRLALLFFADADLTTYTATMKEEYYKDKVRSSVNTNL